MAGQWQHDRPTRRRFLVLAASSVSTAMVLAACGGAPASPASPSAASPTSGAASKPTDATKPAATTAPTTGAQTKPTVQAVSLNYWHGWTEQWEEMTKFVAESFGKKFPNITVKEIVVPGAELMTKLLSAVAAGNPPDTITVYSAINIPSLVEQGAILALDDHAGREELDAAKEWFHPAVLDLGTYKGKVWGLSYWQQTACIGWNKRIFKEVGLDPEKPPKTIDELDAMAEKLTKIEGDQIVRMGHMPANYWQWAAAWGGKFFDEQNNKITASDPKNVEMFTWMASYSKKYDIRKVQAFEQGLASERAGVLDPFVAGKIAIHEIGGPWKLGDFKKYAPPEGFEFGIAPSPNPAGMSGVSTYSYGDFTVVPKGTKNPNEAWQFVKYTGGLGGTLDDYFTVLTWGGRPINVPVTTKILDHPPLQQLIKEYPGFQEMIDMFLKGNRVGLPPKMPVGTFYSTRLNAARDKIRLLELEPKAALEAVTQEVQKELDSFLSKQNKS